MIIGKTTRQQLFETELGYIKEHKIKEFAEEAINRLPDYFFTAPASFKHHPDFARGKNGLYYHTIACVRVCMDLSRLEIWSFPNRQIDLAIVALLLHDGWKNGEKDYGRVVPNHPEVAKTMIEKDEHLRSLINPDDFKEIVDCIWTHMGYSNRDTVTGKEILPIPATPLQEFVHLCDFIASREYINETVL